MRAIVSPSRKVKKAKPPKSKASEHWITRTDGGRALYLNAGVPLTAANDPICLMHYAVCLVCGFGYSHMMQAQAAGESRVRCDECRGDAMGILALALQREGGINLGWRRVDESLQEIGQWGRGGMPLGVHGFKVRE